MIAEPLTHPLTKTKLNRAAHKPPHALLLTGPAGIGKATLADWLAAQMLQISPEQVTSYPHILRIASDNGKAIGIEAVRQLEHFVSLKISSKHAISRLVLLYDAHLLTGEAQNALLKTLEEPPADTVLLLTSARRQALLPTILSRVQVIDVTPPPLELLENNLQALPADKRQQILAVSGGLPGLAMALASNDQEHPLVQAAQTARKLLQADSFTRLTMVDPLAKDKQQTDHVLFILMQMAHAAILTGRASERWHKIMKAAYDTQTAIINGTQPKLALTSLMLNL